MKSQYISELLHRHECVIIPGLGGFLTNYLPARIDNETNRFFPPSCQIAFNAGLSGNDGILADFVARNEQISYKEALGRIRLWVDDGYDLLRKGKAIELPEVGCIRINPEGNLQFEAANRINFLGDAFGLTSFIAKDAVRLPDNAEVRPPRVQPWPARVKYLIPETFKWAAVIAPFIGLILWGSLNTDSINRYVSNYSGIYSSLKEESVISKTDPAEVASIPYTDPVQDAGILTPSGILSKALPDFNPSAISYQAIRQNSVPGSGDLNLPTAGMEQYFVIGGAFKEHSNAERLVSELIHKGFPAAIIDTTNTGMFVVSIQGFASHDEAVMGLRSIRQGGYSSAWIMQKR